MSYLSIISSSFFAYAFSYQLVKSTHISSSPHCTFCIWFYLIRNLVPLMLILGRPTNMLTYPLSYQLIESTHILSSHFYSSIVPFVFGLIIQIFLMPFLHSFTGSNLISRLNLLSSPTFLKWTLIFSFYLAIILFLFDFIPFDPYLVHLTYYF